MDCKNSFPTKASNFISTWGFHLSPLGIRLYQSRYCEYALATHARRIAVICIFHTHVLEANQGRNSEEIQQIR